ncbi:GNAT family N-acetyltransferase [Microbacterium thalli]|uniref:GNAT family N-acetyltransferase n=1 Tax=Microbacterium thalli TaxID=3027921 RepID=UPI002365DE36|nr:GNAT family N-acetyltransferase [Microbacterium thalli]MDD7929706.1 GNAT family N-acetyltransferase [Microbacterium thalli]
MIAATSRLVLRRMTPDDLSPLRTILADPITMTAYEGAFDDDESARWLERNLQRYDDDGFGLWAVDLPGAGMIGQCGITRQRIDDDEVFEVGYLFNRAYWHRGYATEAATAARDWAFRDLGVATVWAKVRDTNLASMNVAIRLGMTVRRRFVVHYRGVDMPHLGFAVDRSRETGSRTTLSPRPTPPRAR